MDSENLKNIIYEYLKNTKINYAIMINGEWGSGKTFFVKKNIIKRYSNSLYISLYGVSSIDKLSEKIYLEIIKSKALTNKFSIFLKKIYDKYLFFKIVFFPFLLIWRILKFIYNSFFKLIWLITYNIINLKFNINLSSIEKKDFYGILKLFKNINKYIFVIDDLERCSIPIEEVMGYLNDFVEHKNVKCIIVANEEEIIKTNNNNYELKILTALNEKIDYYDLDRQSDKNSKKKKEKVDLVDLKNRIDYLYNNINKYKIMKEKLIWKEYLFIPNIDDIYDNLAFKYKDSEQFFEKTLNTKHIVINSMKQYNFYNIRTLEYYFDIFYHIYLLTDKYINECKIDNKYVYESISKSVMMSCIGLKKGYNLKGLLSSSKFDIISFEPNKNDLFQKNLYLSFDFVNEYLINNSIVKSNIDETLKNFAESNYDKIDDNDPFNLLNEYWYCNSDELTKILNEIFKNIEANKYNYKLYSLIIKKISYIENMGYKNKIIDDIINKIEEKINMVDDVSFDEHNFFEEGNVAKIYNQYMEKLKEKVKVKKDYKKSNELEKILDSNDWGVKLYNYVNEQYDNYLSQHKFFSTLNIDKIIQNVKKFEIKNIYYLKYTLDSIYNFSNINEYCKGDIDSLNYFMEKLMGIDLTKIDDPMLKYPINLLIKTTKSLTERLEK